MTINAINTNATTMTMSKREFIILARTMGYDVVERPHHKCLLKALQKQGIEYSPNCMGVKTGHVSDAVFSFLLKKWNDGGRIRVHNTIKILVCAEMHKEGRGLKMSIVKKVYSLAKGYYMPQYKIEAIAEAIKIATADERGLADYYGKFVASNLKSVKLTKKEAETA